MDRKENLLEEKLSAKTAKIGIVGLGYVGLPLAVAFSEAGFTVLGFDVAPEKVSMVNEGKSYIVDVPADHVSSARAGGFWIVGASSARRWANGGWTVILPERVLREWFQAVPQAPGEMLTLYAVLAIKPDVAEQEIKSAYRRLAFQWHPDRCHEPDAAEQFKFIAHAYQVLSDPTMRRKYDAGRAFEASLRHRKPTIDLNIGYDMSGNLIYRAPLRCGWVLCEGTQVIGRFVVAAVLAWEDIIQDSLTMVVSWPRGADKFEVSWS